MNRKRFKARPLFALFFLGAFFLLLTVFCNLPCRYPFYADSPEAVYGVSEEEAAKFQVPAWRMRIMSTDALARSMIDNPLVDKLPLDYQNLTSSDPYEPPASEGDATALLSRFVRELRRREDAGQVLWKIYRQMPLYGERDPELVNITRWDLLELLLAQPEFTGGFSPAEQNRLEETVREKQRELEEAGYQRPVSYFFSQRPEQ